MDKSTGGTGGVVVNMGSVAGLERAMDVTPIYIATKHAVVGLSRGLGVRSAMRIILILWIVIIQ
jgi:NAD(P)-dependent dehydrogenase (short-subunit alcohol dehydrogenase family)